MKYLKIIIKSTLFTTGSILLLTFLITILNYLDIINGKTLNISKIIIPLFSLNICGYIMGKYATKNGWLEGLKIGLIIVAIIFIYNIIFENISLKDIIFYLALISSSTLGSMIGINKKRAS